jgi:hypothetical protein
MEGVRQRLEALSASRKAMRERLREALEQLRREMLGQEGKLSARELEELRDYIAKMREQMKTFRKQQEDLLRNTEEGANPAEMRKRQEDLDRRMERLLAQARNLLDARRRRRERRLEFPDSPYAPDREEVQAPPREEDTNDPLPGQKDPKGKAGANKADKKADAKEDEEKEPLYMPALGGPRVKPDPRFDKKRRPVARPPGKGDPHDPGRQREDLEDRQSESGRNLDAAQQSLASDEASLEQMLRSLEEAMRSNPSQRGRQQRESSEGGDELSEQLQQLLQSDAMRQAMAMAGRMRQGRQMMPGSPNASPPSQGNTQGGEAPGSREANLAKLDPHTRAVILRLPQSRLRDELIQGMAEQGPEAYRPFIEDYFKRLTQTKAPGK